MVTHIGSPITLGSQGLTCGPQGFGAMSIGLTMGSNDLYGKPSVKQDDVNTLVARMVELGCNHIDTAQIYQSAVGLMVPCCYGCSYLQNSESLLKQAIQNVGRNKVVIATKVSGMKKNFGAKAHVKKTCYESCARMGVDCIDLYYIIVDLYYMHRIDQDVPIEVSMMAMKELIADGKIKYVGLSEASSATIRRAHAVQPITCVQMEWSLWARDLEDEIVPTCRELGIGIVAYSPLGRGMLTGTIKKEELGSMDFRVMGKVGYIAKEDNMQTVEALQKLAEAKGVTPGQLALAWLHKHGTDLLGGTGPVPIPGTTKIVHLEMNLGAVSLAKSLTNDDMQAIEKAVPKEEFCDPYWRYGDQRQAVWATDKNPPLEGYIEPNGCGCSIQ
eukprot:CAMPEP_0172933682 /NCGR_PEP_ID=MMETSP1075-20121228/220629_1 /TAXON_ID=2916 /ORGANISM="Ceratium fusus, Strain PA161109" /LENGTH=385 /DNA_ID=CAMNT_0013795025 /DNA_START=14 /DNA_END=1172 /DNA_ORIENTATION=-